MAADEFGPITGPGEGGELGMCHARVRGREKKGQQQPSIFFKFRTCLLVAAESEAAHRNGTDFRASSAELAILHVFEAKRGANLGGK